MVTLRATLKNGETIERQLGRIWLRAGYDPMPTTVTWPGEGPGVAICMATSRPPVGLFYAQAPGDADFIALCDQDNVWRPDKIETLLAAFRPNQQLIFSDARVMDEGGRVLVRVVLVLLPEQLHRPATLMVDNTITGAASLFRTSLLAEILLFPKQVGAAFHDHWIGLVAPLKGDIGYVDRALYNYVQHATGVIGHNYYKGTGTLAAAATLVRAFRRPHGVPTVAAQLLKQAVDDHVFVMQKVVLALTLLLSNPVLAPERRAALKRFTRLDTSLFAAFCEKIAALLARRHSLNLEGSTPLVHDRRMPPERRTALQAGQTAPAADRPPRTAFAGHCRRGRSAAEAGRSRCCASAGIQHDEMDLPESAAHAISRQIRRKRQIAARHDQLRSRLRNRRRPTRDRLTRRRRLLFYPRQEEHASRNLFELGMIALAMLVQDPRVDLSGWSFHGIGSMGGNTLGLKPGLPFALVPKTSLQEYIRMMPSYDVGLSLMLTPHPSLVPIEMASAGMWTVTNTLANKTAERLQAISTNLIGVEPTVGAIVNGMVQAMARVGEIDERLAGAQVEWPTDWDHAFPPETIGRIRAFLGEPG